MKTMAVLSFLISLASLACAGPIENLYPPRESEPSGSVYLVSHGWHAGIVIKREDIPSDVWPENEDFPDAEYLEVGWGDQDYYQAPGFNLWIALKAAFWPTPSVLHIVGFNGPIESYFPESDIIELKLSQRGFKQLCGYIQNSYARDDSGKTIRLGPGLYGDSAFYLSNEKFYLFKTCNVWTAKAIRSAGCPITPFYAITVENLMFQARKFGRVLRVP
jgi:uncharacterized protein (TIGR02117 family)